MLENLFPIFGQVNGDAVANWKQDPKALAAIYGCVTGTVAFVVSCLSYRLAKQTADRVRLKDYFVAIWSGLHQGFKNHFADASVYAGKVELRLKEEFIFKEMPRSWVNEPPPLSEFELKPEARLHRDLGEYSKSWEVLRKAIAAHDSHVDVATDSFREYIFFSKILLEFTGENNLDEDDLPEIRKQGLKRLESAREVYSRFMGSEPLRLLGDLERLRECPEFVGSVKNDREKISKALTAFNSSREAARKTLVFYNHIFSKPKDSV